MSRETFLNYKNYRWFWLSLLALILMTALYFLDSPIGGRNGGTVLGYTYGGLSTLGIIYLMYYGMRKRSYYSNISTVKGTLAAHVWIGIALIFIVPLHSGFSFDLNVHTLAYALMVIVILSGIWGVVMYERLPLEIRSQRGGGSLGNLLEQIQTISEDINALVEPRSNDDNSDRSDAFLRMANRIDFKYEPSLKRALWRRNPKIFDNAQSVELLGELTSGEQEEGFNLIRLVNRKRELVRQIQDEARALTWVRVWLYIHLPVSFALCVALAIHIVSVFFYW